jgi:biopolymer transport protein ExbD
MRFPVHQRRHPPAVIIVALIDILVVLLIFLMVTTTFKQQPALRLALPESSQSLKSGASETPPLVVSVTADGNVFLGTDRLPVTIGRLREELARRAAANPQLRLALSADKGAPFGRIVNVMDAAKETGIKSVNAFTKQAAK